MLIKNGLVSNAYMVYIIYGVQKKISIHISNNVRSVFKELSEARSYLIYFEKFSNRSKALRKKKYLSSMMKCDLIKLIKKRNPDMLDLIFTINENSNLNYKWLNSIYIRSCQDFLAITTTTCVRTELLKKKENSS